MSQHLATKNVFQESPEKQKRDYPELLNITVLTGSKEFASLKTRWNQLNDHSPRGVIFCSWEWLYTWWEIYRNDGNRTLYILTAQDQNGELLGIAPLQIVTNHKRYFPSSRQILFLGAGETGKHAVFGEYVDLLIKPGAENQVCDAFSAYLYQNRALWDGAKFQQLLGDSLVSRLFERQQAQLCKTVSENGFRTLVDLPETYHDYLMSLRKKKRNNITRVFKRLQQEQAFSIRSAIEEMDSDQAIDILADLNRGRRGDLNKQSAFNSARFEQFHKKLMRRLMPLNKVQLRIIWFEEKPVAALYLFIDKQTIHAYQSGFIKEHGHRYSLLTTLITQEIAASINDKQLKYFNFMYDEDEKTYKKRYASSTETMYDISFDQKKLSCSIYKLLHGPVKESIRKTLKLFLK